MSDADHLSRVDDDFEVEYPGADALASEAFVNLVRVGDRLEAELSRRLRQEAGLSTTGMMLLAVLDGLGGRATSAEVGKHMPITSAAITSLVDTNERRGFVERNPDSDDRRKVQIVLTDEGRSLIDRLLPGVHQLELEIATVLSATEQETLLELLGRLQGAAAKAADQPPVLAAAPRKRPARLDGNS